MTIVSIIAAVARNGVIGKGNALPWTLPEDLRHFKALTFGHPVIMGRKTWESLAPKFRPLPGRRNLVVSRNPAFRAEGGEVAASLAEALRQVAGADEAFVIGGAELYAQALAHADRLYLTEIDAEVAGDAHFPDLDRQLWQETARESRRSEDGLSFAFVRLERRDLARPD